jgi:TfoX/Sxy family transcriptional regulator of competence genes
MAVPSHDDLQNRLSLAAETLSLDKDLTFKPMFGGIMAYTDGHVFASLSNIGLALKLSSDDQAALLQETEAKRLQYEPDSPPSKQYIVVPSAMLTDSAALSVWVRQSMAFASAQKKPVRKKTA